ncbi:hypothetical protein PRIPAC_81963 [Pristionchus pacificus]|uniref:Uncharacterized protein n=1 Tax=Pristionchus pacificus TaxID=54126 RepID=A0A2A6CM69_PRIPA|nr:hypothetical protein PRIPAC_81963 [Pristionchus pacificus]|eukprot:PDM79206.1 hypothetical protein PRIPAC_31785 [Pristionchus pacificus]
MMMKWLLAVVVIATTTPSDACIPTKTPSPGIPAMPAIPACKKCDDSLVPPDTSIFRKVRQRFYGHDWSVLGADFCLQRHIYWGK